MISPSLYAQAGFPVFQNRTYATEAEAQECMLGLEDLIEVGCGKGAFLEQMAASGRRYYRL